MKYALALLLSAPTCTRGTASPVAKVISMLSDLQAKVIQEGDVAQKEFAEFSEWCEDRNRNLDFEIRTGKAQVEELKATIAQEESLSLSLTAKIEDLGGRLATDQADLKAATAIRNHEASDFAAEERDLVETIDMLNRAVLIVEREMQGGASMMQLKNAGSIAEALSVMVQASMIHTADASKLTAFVQSRGESQDTDSDQQLGAPAADVYQSHSGDIVETLKDLLDKAEEQLDSLRKKETSATHNFEMLKQSIEDEIAVASKDMSAAKRDSAGSAERKATADGDLSVTSKELAADVDVKGNLHQTCMTRAQEFESETKSRGEELQTLAQAKKVIQEATGGASSFVQLERMNIASGEHLANFEAVRVVRDLARSENSRPLALLANRMAAAMHSGSSDPFAKIRGLISDMISKLEAEASQDATRKAYCDKELSETNTKKAEKTAEIEKLTSRIDRASAQSSTLKEEVASLQTALSKLASSQAQMDQMRRSEHEAYVASRAEQEKGLEGIKLALKLLKEYYATDAAHEAAEGAAAGIIGLLETIESDMTKNLAALITGEESAASEYDSMSKQNEIERNSKEQDVRYKVKEAKKLDGTISENTADRTSVQAELDATNEYLSKIEEQCIDKAETYAERKRRYVAEIAGLKQALEILENETAFLQRVERHHQLRGGLRLSHQ